VTDLAPVGVFGGSGFYQLFDDHEVVEVDTPWGRPSAPVHLGSVGGRRVAFLPRHGEQHQFPPHRIDYRANVWALREVGVRAILAPCASGSLQPSVRPGDVVVCDQLVDRTYGREQTYFDGPVTNHVSFADPYCPVLREVVAAAAREGGFPTHDRGTVVVVQGPRFSTRAESAWFRAQGWEVVNMTQYPEAFLARELGLCYSSLALITDYDTGLEGIEGVQPVQQDEIFRFFEANVDRLRAVVRLAVDRIDPDACASCAAATNGVLPVPPSAR
jgi:5'-methylthioadenosine phosphorylase